VHDHSPALDSGFRRNDVSCYPVFKSVIPAKAGAFRYPGLFRDLLSSYKKEPVSFTQEAANTLLADSDANLTKGAKFWDWEALRR
jgi:hypothetical protein